MTRWWAILCSFSVLIFITIFSVCGRADTPSTPLATAFPYASAVMNRIVNGERKPIRVSGDINGRPVSGSGAYTFTPAIAANFAEQSGMSNRQMLIAKVSDRENTFSFEANTETVIYYDSDYRELAEVDQGHTSGTPNHSYGNYTVITSKGGTPAKIHVNDFGPLESMAIYKDKTKTALIGSATSSYVVEPDTASSVIYRISTRYFGKSDYFIGYSDARYRFDTAGNCTFVSVVDHNKRSTLKYMATK